MKSVGLPWYVHSVKGQLGQHRVLVVAKSEGRFPFFVQKRIRAQANAKLLLLFAR